MTNQRDHSITPSPELVRQWMERTEYDEHTWFYESYIAEQAARWGADQELEACCEWLDRNNQWARCDIDELHDARRPKSPSLAEEALMGLEQTVIMLMPVTGRKKIERFDIIRRALERLKELEALND